MDAWKKCVLSARETHVHKTPRFKGGGYLGFGVGGGKCRFYLYGRADFSEKYDLSLRKKWTRGSLDSLI